MRPLTRDSGFDPTRAWGRIEISQCSTSRQARGVLSFRSEAREALGSEAA
jgi:hypothetical protein